MKDIDADQKAYVFLLLFAVPLLVTLGCGPDDGECSAGAVQPRAEELVGLRAMDYMKTLPILRDLVICREASCHDRKGGNDNGFTNKAEFVRREEGDRVVILDAAGSGCLYSIWYSWLNYPLLPAWVKQVWERGLGEVRFTFGDEDSPRLEVPLRDLVGSDPFDYPLAIHADQSTGGYVSYVPITFRDGLRISVEGGRMPLFFYHNWYHVHPAGTDVADWTGKENLTEIASMWDPVVAWEPAGPQTHEVVNVNVPPGSRQSLVTLDGAGTILCIRMKLPEDDAALRSTFLQAWWDEDSEPSLNGPLSLLFAVQNRFSNKPMEVSENADFKGLVVGQDPEGLFYLRLPMPYAARARLALENRGAEPVRIDRIRIEYDERQVLPGLGRSAGYFRTQFREDRDLTPGRDYLLAQLYGRGHIVGTVLAVEDASETFLEGDERVYTDGSRSPLIMGDATETYFSGSWYFFDRAFSCPLHGAPTFRMGSKMTGSPAEITMYRFHVTDLVPYRSEARFSIQHGPFNDVPGHYRSLVFYYGLPGKGLVRTDAVRMAVPEDLQAHEYAEAEPARRTKRSGFFEGEFNGQDLGLTEFPARVPPILRVLLLTGLGIFHSPPEDSPDRVEFTVCEHDGPYEFTVNLDPAGSAILLRRVFDQSIPDQRARVEVDGRPAGVWFNAGANPWKIWSEDDLVLSPLLTAGKSRCRIRVVPVSPVFSAVEYTVFSILLPK